MPWNDNSDSGNKSGGKKPSPWGDSPSGGSNGSGGQRPQGGPGRRPGGGGAPPPPDFNELSKQFSAKFEKMFGGGGDSGGGGRSGGGGFRPGAYAMVAGVIFALWAASGIYFVAANEQAVVQRFGAYSRWSEPGMRYHLPFPVESVTKVQFTDVRRTSVGGTEENHLLDESLMLTGDENIVDIQFTILWKVKDSQQFLFNLDDTASAVKAVGESAMREVVGSNSLQPIITTARGQIQDQVRDLMQQVLDNYGAGVVVQEILINGANPPPEVVQAFRAVQSANQDAEATVNDARGVAAQTVQAAIGDRAEAIRTAEGEAAAFNQVYEQYRLAPRVTRERLYIETMQRVVGQSNRVIIDNEAATAPIILPPEAFRGTTAGQTRATTGVGQ